MVIERIIMVTGSKGGGGKTPVAVSIALALEELGIPLVMADFNFNNPDAYAIFHGTNIEKRRKNNMIKNHVLGRDHFYHINNDFWLTRWDSTTGVGLPSTDDMWAKIGEICQLEFPSEHQPKVLILDTNLTLPLICPSLHSIQDYKHLPPIEVFHLWSPSIVLQLEEQERFVQAIDILNRFSPGFEKRMTHIFTPRHHASSGFFGTFSSIMKGEFKVGKNVKFKQAKPKPITFSEMKETLFADFLPTILNLRSDMELEIEELMQTWLNNIIQQLEAREYKTHNVLIVPTVVHNIALLVEKLTIKPRRTTKTIQEDLGALYQIVLNHFEQYKEAHNIIQLANN